MGHGLFHEYVTLNDAHVYSHSLTGLNYMGFSSVFANISKPFFEGLHKTVAFSEGVQPSEIRARWDGQRDEGSRIDNVLTLYAQTGKIANENLDLKEAVEQILSHYKGYHKCFEQMIVYNDKYRTATAIDKCGLFTNRSDSPFFISDFKCFERMDIYSHKGWLKAPFEHLPDTKFVKIAMQLTYGAYHLEQLTGKRCKELFIHLIKPSSCKKIGDETIKVEQQIIKVPYMKRDIELLLSTFDDEIKAKLAEQKQNKELNIIDLI